MIYEIRTYTIRPRTMAEVERRWNEAYPVRAKYSSLAGLFRTEIGPLNEFIHIWPYADMDERNRIRAAAVQEEAWPPKIAEFIVNQKVEIVNSFPFAPEWAPGKLGPIYEMRQYRYQPGTLPDIMSKWEAALPERLKLSPLVMLGNLEVGPTVNSYIHIWAYSSIDERDIIRAEAAAAGNWPPAVTEPYLDQLNKIMVPLSISPAQ